MTDPGQEAGRPPADPEQLRRRLYRPGATAADVAAFAASASSAGDRGPDVSGTAATGYPAGGGARTASAVDEEAPHVGSTSSDDAVRDGEEDAGPDGGAGPPPTRHRRRVVAAGIAAAAVVLVLAVQAAAPTRSISPGPSPFASAPAVPDAASVSAAERTAFIRRLTQGRQAGVSAWLDRHARALPAALGQATRSDTLEFAGDGTRVVPLDPPSIGDDGGRVTVLLVLGADADAAWTLLRRGGATSAGGGSVGAVSGGQAAGALVTSTISYAPGGRPDRLHVVTPAGVRWGVAVVFSN